MARAARVRAGFAMQGRACARLGSPFMARLMALCAERLAPGGAVADAVLFWPGDAGIAADNPMLRLAGGLHRLVLAGADADLARVYPPHEVPDGALWSAVERALARHQGALLEALGRAPQTNEVRRAAALIPALGMVAAATGRPLALWELGCAAGLNLRADLFRLEASGRAWGPADAPPLLRPGWQGPAPAPCPLEVMERRGVDLAPFDPALPEDRLRLLSYLWPDQPERRALTEAALARAAEAPADVARGDAVEWLRAELPRRREGIATVVFHTVAWQYLPEAAREKGEALIEAAGARATRDAPLARIGMEADGRRTAGLTLTLWPGGATVALARVDFHGRSVTWTGPVALPRL
ncbi:DUF2332 domain-containing protein [Rhodovulum sp. 12E13]|uniref:DUF2332 domain-containing protein n=1 Tax=Rhodovulum sp. 12E13 TaxID=2203891 RepID=UPI001F17622A|nr:DUF2332 family protein [Rhodovulum sp. 12E13]